MPVPDRWEMYKLQPIPVPASRPLDGGAGAGHLERPLVRTLRHLKWCERSAAVVTQKRFSTLYQESEYP